MRDVAVPGDRQRVRHQFSWAGTTGTVDVMCMANEAPEAYGCWAAVAKGFPVCIARVSYPHMSYRTMFGWVQLVRSTDNDSLGQEFEVDPFALFADAQSPYAWYGIEPTLFDAPSRESAVPLEWVAHSWLATTPVDEIRDGKPRRVVPLLGFDWGFQVVDGRIELRDIAGLGTDDWRADVAVLERSYPSPRWTFAGDLHAP
jgi:hypothetical protein